MGMLPIPFSKFTPKIYQEDDMLSALGDKADEHIQEWLDDTQHLEWLLDPVRCPSEFLDELGYYVAAGINKSDSDSAKRKKIHTAVQSHKNRGSWENDVKIRIDAYVGGDSSIVNQYENDNWVMLGSEEVDTTNYWAVMGGDGSTDNYGIRLLGTGREDVLRGVVCIDVDSSTLTESEVEGLKEELEDDAVPAYFIVILGYLIAGVFVAYSNGEMG